MTAPESEPIRGARSDTMADRLMRIVVATTNSAIDSLCRGAATARRLDSPAAAAHIDKLSQAIAGMTLDALRTWPATRE